MKKQILKIFILLLVLNSTIALSAQDIKKIEFINKPLSDVLVSIGNIFNTSVLTDDTISGMVTYRLNESDFITVLEELSKTYKFYYTIEDNIYHISKIFSNYLSDKQLLTIKSNDVDIFRIVKSVSEAIGKTILFDPLPSEKLSLNSIDIDPAAFLFMLTEKFPDFELVITEDYYYIKRKASNQSQAKEESIKEDIITVSNSNQYNISLEKGDFFDVIEDLFSKAGKEYVILYKSNNSLSRMDYSNKTFEELLLLILDLSSGGYTVTNDIYYIYDVNRQDIIKKYKTIEYIQLNHIAATEITKLLPNTLNSNTFFKVDEKNNGIILSGSIEEIKPIKEYILSIDIPTSNKNYHRFELTNIEAKKFIELLPAYLKTPEPLVIEDLNSIISIYTENQISEIENLIKIVDISEKVYHIAFKYIKAEEFLEHIPPAFEKKEFQTTGTNSMLYFQGTEDKYKLLSDHLSIIDKPKPQIRYKLLILQNQQSTGSEWNFEVSNSVETEDSETAYLGTLGNLINLDFDILSTFGYQFAVKLNLALTDNQAKVLADTTLNGLSGESVKFRNSSTYRYQDLEVDDDGEVSKTGVTREITTGLFLSVKGWVSGEDMITMEVESTLSKKGTSSGTSNSTLPPTSERIINTNIRTPSGKPIIIGGLMQEEYNTTEKKVPFLGDIPLLGYLFSYESTSVENTELVIYIIPYIEKSIDTINETEVELQRLFDKFITK